MSKNYQLLTCVKILLQFICTQMITILKCPILIVPSHRFTFNFAAKKQTCRTFWQRLMGIFTSCLLSLRDLCQTLFKCRIYGYNLLIIIVVFCCKKTFAKVLIRYVRQDDNIINSFILIQVGRWPERQLHLPACRRRPQRFRAHQCRQLGRLLVEFAHHGVQHRRPLPLLRFGRTRLYNTNRYYGFTVLPVRP